MLYNISEGPYHRVFGSWQKALTYYKAKDTTPQTYLCSGLRTSLVVPDAHVSPGQDLRRFEALGGLIACRKPDRIIFMGDFITLEALSNWDLSKSGVMEGRRYAEDVKAGREALSLALSPLSNLRGYCPDIVYIYGNHEYRAARYLETKPELREHLCLDTDLDLEYFGVNYKVKYRDTIEFEGVSFTHAPQNAANQPVAGKYAIHRAAEMSAKSLVFGHTHRKESVNYYRHGSDDITQTLSAGAFFEHTDSYAYGGLNAYWRGVCLLTHWAPGRFDVEEFSIERLNLLYGGK